MAGFSFRAACITTGIGIAAVAGLWGIDSSDALLGRGNTEVPVASENQPTGQANASDPTSDPAKTTDTSSTHTSVPEPMNSAHSAHSDHMTNAPAGASGRIPAPAEVKLPPDGQEGVWQMECYLSHFKTDDPIVYPNTPGASHMHSFFGNTSTTAASTAQSLLATKSNCIRNMGSSDKSSYWIPSLYRTAADGAKELVPADAQRIFAYYRRVGPDNGPKVQPFPVGLRMIAGDVTATSAQPKSILYWDCGFGGPQYGGIPKCEDDDPLHVKIRFPSCWDGKNLDSPNHKSHMAYPAASGRCPSTHPVPVPELTLEPHYLHVPGGPSYSLASGSPYSMHADFYNAWDPHVQKALVEQCLNIRRGCFDINRDGSTLFRPDSPDEPHVPPIDLSKY